MYINSTKEETLQRHSDGLSEGFRLSILWNRLDRGDQSGAVSSTKEHLIMKKRESVKLKESAS